MRFAASMAGGSAPRSLILHELQKQRAVDHDLIAGFHALQDVELILRASTQGDMLARETAVRLQQVQEGQILIIAQNRRDRHQQTIDFLARLDAHPHVHLLL